MATLYELSEKEAALERQTEALMETTHGEVTEEAEALFDEQYAIEGAVRDKLDGYYKVMRNLDEHAEALRKEAERLTSRADKAERAVAFMEERVLGYLIKNDIKEIRTPHTTFKQLLAGGKQALIVDAPDEAVPRAYKKTTFKLVVDNRELSDEDYYSLIEHVAAIQESFPGVTLKTSDRVMKTWLEEGFEAGDFSLAHYAPRKSTLGY